MLALDCKISVTGFKLIGVACLCLGIHEPLPRVEQKKLLDRKLRPDTVPNLRSSQNGLTFYLKLVSFFLPKILNNRPDPIIG